MSSSHPFPPPGSPPPEDPVPRPSGAQPPPPPGPAAPGAPYPSYPATGAPAPGWQAMPGAAHRPGAFPLRPLSLGEIYDGAFRIIRYNPKATVGAAVLVTAVAMVIPVLLSLVLTYAAGLSLDLYNTSGEVTDSEALGLAGYYGSTLLGSMLAWVGITLVTGTIAHVARGAAVGRRLTLEESWAATRGKRWRLLGLAAVVALAALGIWVVWGGLLLVVALLTRSVLVSVLWALLSGLGAVVAMGWLWIRLFYLPVPTLMLEREVGVFGALGRSWGLTRGFFWRVLGIALLTWLIGTIGGGILATPFSFGTFIGSALWPDQALVITVVCQALGQVAQNAFVAPFLASVTALQYLDLRMRKEAHDVELMSDAGLLPR